MKISPSLCYPFLRIAVMLNKAIWFWAEVLRLALFSKRFQHMFFEKGDYEKTGYSRVSSVNIWGSNSR